MGKWLRERSRAIDHAINGQTDALKYFPEELENLQIMEAFSGGMGSITELTEFVKKYTLDKLQDYMEIYVLMQERDHRDKTGMLKVSKK